MIQVKNSWSGFDGKPGSVFDAMPFYGSNQRDAAYAWAKSAVGPVGTFDVLTFVPSAEQAGASQIVCTGVPGSPCGKEMQNGRGAVSHGLCGACLLIMTQKLAA